MVIFSLHVPFSLEKKKLPFILHDVIDINVFCTGTFIKKNAKNVQTKDTPKKDKTGPVVGRTERTR